MTGPALQQLVDAEEVRQLKARYCRLLDQQNWADWPSVFTDDCVLEWIVDGARVEPVRGVFPIVAFLRNQVAGKLTHHLCANPEIEFTGADTATATWAAVFVHAGGTRRGYGYYYDRYRRVSGRWLIERYRYEPLWVETGSPVDVQVVPGVAVGAE